MLARAIIEERERILGTADDPDRLAEMVVALRRCLDEAPENARALLKMRHVEDRTPAEIARQVGCSSESVRALMFRLKNSLRRCIERKTGGASLA
jgi:RNA polymerase sigma-70 factor (ECF subfamily)